MQHADLSPSTQFLLVSLLAVAGAVLFTRAIVFFRREYAGIRPIYPSVWSAVQCRSLEYFRLLVGLTLIPLWGSFLFLAPSMPTNWPFGYAEMIFLILLLLISNAWVLLLVTRNWGKLGAISRSFWVTITFLLVWWGATFAAMGWLFAMASASPLAHISGVYAALGVLPLTGTAG
jgi:hypothetical protein